MQSVYSNLKLPKFSDRPYYYSNFVSTIDGKVQVLENTEAYWPLGSKLDYQTLIELRTYADVLIHGKNTALSHPTLQSLSKDSFWELRKKNENNRPIVYIVISNNPEENLIPKLKSEHPMVKTMLVTNKSANVPDKVEGACSVVRLGERQVDLSLLSHFLFKRELKRILVEGGPMLMGSFLKYDLIDEIFLTISPKVLGGEYGKTLTMAEGNLLGPQRVKSYELISVNNIDSELYLRYRKRS